MDDRGLNFAVIESNLRDSILMIEFKVFKILDPQTRTRVFSDKRDSIGGQSAAKQPHQLCPRGIIPRSMDTK